MVQELNFDFLNDPDFDLEPTIISRQNLDLKTPVKIINDALDKYKNRLKVAHLNVRSLPKNILEFQAIIYKTYFDIVAVSESWLTKNTPKDRFTLDNFNIFRRDRLNKRGGGCALFVRSHYNAKIIKTPCDKEIPEMLWVEITVNKKKIAVGVLYKAPKITYKVFVNMYECLVGIYAKYEHTLLLGDFNVNFLDLNALDTKFLLDSFIEPFSLKQIVEKPTRITEKSKTLIDLMLVNKPNNVLFSGVCDAPGVSDHCLTYLAYSLKKEKFKPYNITKRDFNNFDKIKFEEEVEFLPWENVLAVNDVNSKVVVLENLINSVLDNFAPYKTFTITKKNATPWVSKNPEIKNLMDLRDDTKIEYNVSGNNNLHEQYKILRNKVTALRRQELAKMFNEKINKNIKNSKDFYKESKILNIIPTKNEKCHVNFSANKLNSAFVSNNNANIDQNLINEQIRQLYVNNPPCLHKFNFQPVSEQDVVKIVKALKSNSCGVDDINGFILKLLIHRISSIVTHIINISLEQGTFPERWKAAIIKPIPKIPFPLKEADFRPISLLCTLSKVMEKLMHRQICAYLIKHDFLDPYQSAYQPNHSCTTAHLKITEDILEAFDDSELVLLVLLDFSKAFDTVNHVLLLEKLKILGFQEDALKWVNSYLSNRKQKVKTDQEQSDWIDIINGVPQGSILGPLLFTILVSDIRRYIYNGSYHAYADDLQLYYPMKPRDANENIPLVNEDLERISEYCHRSALRLNEGKCYYMFVGSRPAIKSINEIPLTNISINNKPIKRVEHVRNLGLTYDEILSWRKHVNLCVSRAMSNFICISRFKRFLSLEAKMMLCESMVLSQFNFCDAVYLNIDIYLQNKIQKIQNMCLRFIFDTKKYSGNNYDQLRSNLKWMDMKERQISHSLVTLFKILNGKGPAYLRDMYHQNSDISTRHTRSFPGNIWIGNSQYSAIHRKSFRIYISRIWNILPDEIKSSSTVNTFKNKIKKLFLSKSINLPPP